MSAPDEVALRPAKESDGPALTLLDKQTWSPQTTPSPPFSADYAFFGQGKRPSHFLVAAVNGAPVGYVGWARPTPLSSNSHVMHIEGLAVGTAWRRRGIGHELVQGACAVLAEQGITKVGLRVLGGNKSALALYRSCGFETEGVLRGEFRIEGELVDDVLMARRL